jgi:hypothetical protein
MDQSLTIQKIFSHQTPIGDHFHDSNRQQPYRTGGGDEPNGTPRRRKPRIIRAGLAVRGRAQRHAFGGRSSSGRIA